MTGNLKGRKVWAYYYLQDGTHMGATLLINPSKDVYEELVRILSYEEGDMWGGIDDYGEYED